MLDKVEDENEFSTQRPGITAIDIIAGENLRRIRTARGFTQERLGEAMGISYQAVQKHETGKTQFSMNRAYEFATVLNIKLQDLFRGTGVFDERVTKSAIPKLSQKGLELAMAHDAIRSEKIKDALRAMARASAQAED